MFKHRVVNYCTPDFQTALEIFSRCDHYNNSKSLLTVETYLTMDIELKYKIARSKFRLSNQAEY
jgi:acyl-ACP thioesterase